MTYWNASRWRDGGYPASAPAMSNPTTPASRKRTASSAISRLELPCASPSDRVDREVGVGRSAAEPVEHRVHHLVERQALLGVQLRGEPDLGVDDAVGGEILGALEGDPLDRVVILHHADGVGERLEVEHQVVALGATVEPRGQFVDVGGRQILVAELLRQFDHGRGRSPPSRWSCSSTLGARWISSAIDMRPRYRVAATDLRCHDHCPQRSVHQSTVTLATMSGCRVQNSE